MNVCTLIHGYGRDRLPRDVAEPTPLMPEEREKIEDVLNLVDPARWPQATACGQWKHQQARSRLVGASRLSVVRLQLSEHVGPFGHRSTGLRNLG